MTRRTGWRGRRRRVIDARISSSRLGEERFDEEVVAQRATGNFNGPALGPVEGQGRGAASNEARCYIGHHLVGESSLPKRGQDRRSALDEHVIDAASAEVLDHFVEVHPAGEFLNAKHFGAAIAQLLNLQRLPVEGISQGVEQDGGLRGGPQQAAIGGDAEAAVEHGAARLIVAAGQSHGEFGVIGQDCLHADDKRAAVAADLMGVSAGFFSGNPAARGSGRRCGEVR